eukprot:4360265-Amphidinium_carterae.1
MELLANVSSLEFPPISAWEKQLSASGALRDDGKVDVQLFVAASLVSTTLSDRKEPNTIVMPEVGPQSLAPTSCTMSQTIAPQADESKASTTLTITSGDVQLPLPVPEVTAGVVVSVASKRYEIGEKLGRGAGGSVHRANPRPEAADISGRLGQGDGPDSVALKLAGGGGGAVGFRPMDTQLAALAVEAVAAAEVRRMAEDEAKRWEGRIFLPVLYAVGKVEAVGAAEVQDMSAMVMEQADGTLYEQRLAGDALVRVAWALACTLSALNKAGFIHGDLKPENVLWKDVPSNVLHQRSRLHGRPMLTDFGASQHFQSFRLGVEMAPSELVQTSAWTRKYAAPEVHVNRGRQQTIKSDMYSWAATIRAVACKDEPLPEHLESLLLKCSASDPASRPQDFVEIARLLEHESYVEWGVALHRAQQDSDRDRLAEGYRLALEAATLLAEERDVWRRNNLACSPENLSEAYFFVFVACMRAAKPARAIEAIQRSVLTDPRCSMQAEWIANLGNAYGALGDASKQRDYLERALRIEEPHY